MAKRKCVLKMNYQHIQVEYRETISDVYLQELHFVIIRRFAFINNPSKSIWIFLIRRLRFITLQDWKWWSSNFILSTNGISQKDAPENVFFLWFKWDIKHQFRLSGRPKNLTFIIKSCIFLRFIYCSCFIHICMTFIKVWLNVQNTT